MNVGLAGKPGPINPGGGAGVPADWAVRTPLLPLVLTVASPPASVAGGVLTPTLIPPCESLAGSLTVGGVSAEPEFVTVGPPPSDAGLGFESKTPKSSRPAPSAAATSAATTKNR
jgi:hypothetical protein